MLRVRDLTALVLKSEPAEFAGSFGPIGLMQQPAPPARVAQVREGKARFTVPLPTLNASTLPVLGHFEDLLVANLPGPLPDGTLQLVVGRNADCDLVVEDPSVSGRHAAIRWDGKKAILVELGSANGTFVNRAKMTGSQVTLKNGDELNFGLSPFIFLLAADLHARLRKWHAQKKG